TRLAHSVLSSFARAARTTSPRQSRPRVGINRARTVVVTNRAAIPGRGYARAAQAANTVPYVPAASAARRARAPVRYCCVLTAGREERRSYDVAASEVVAGRVRRGP